MYIKLVDTLGFVYFVNTAHIVSLEYCITDDGRVDMNHIIVSLSNGEAITIDTAQAEQICNTATITQ